MSRMCSLQPAAPSVQPLLDALEKDAIPQALRPEPAFLVTPATLKEFRALRSPWMRATPRKLHSDGIEIKSPPSHGPPVSIARWPEDHMESKRFPALCYVLNGQGTLQIADYDLHCPAGSFVLIPSGIPHPDGSIPHLEAFDDDRSCDLLWFYRWEGGLMYHICHSHGYRHWKDSQTEICFITGPQSLHYFDLMAAEAVQHGADKRKIYQRLLPLMLMILQRDLENHQFIQDGVSENSDAPHLLPGEEPIRRIENYLGTHIDQELTIDKVAPIVFMSRSHFTKQFRQCTGKSFTAYLTDLRLEKARMLLRDTDWPVEVICLRIGIKSSHLWNLFKQRFGQTPGEYRQSARKEPTS